jgi:hypothetical protein
MKRRLAWWAALPAGSALVVAATFVALCAVSRSAYGEPAGMSERAGLVVGYACIGLGGLVGAALAVLGAYLLLARSRLWVAVPVIVLVCVPALLCSAVYCYGLLVLLALL